MILNPDPQVLPLIHWRNPVLPIFLIAGIVVVVILEVVIALDIKNREKYGLTVFEMISSPPSERGTLRLVLIAIGVLFFLLDAIN